MRVMSGLDRVAPPVVLASLGVLVVAGTGYVGAMEWILLPDVIGEHLPDLGLWMRERLSTEEFNAIDHALLFISMAAFFTAMSVSLIAGPRAWRAAGFGRRGLALMSCGVVLGAVLCGGPLWYYRHLRNSMDASLARSQSALEKVLRKLESGGFEAADRQRMWLFYAQATYMNEGVQTEIPDGEGGTMLFEPSEKDRETRAFTLEMIESLAPSYRHTVRWVILVAIGLAMGFLTPIAPRRVDGGKAG